MSTDGICTSFVRHLNCNTRASVFVTTAPHLVHPERTEVAADVATVAADVATVAAILDSACMPSKIQVAWGVVETAAVEE